MNRKCECGQELLPEWKFCPVCGCDLQFDTMKSFSDMNNLDQAKKLLAEYEKKRADLISNLKEEYDDLDFYEDDDELLSAISDGSLAIAWLDSCKIEYWQDIVDCQEKLVYALEMLGQNDTKAAHNANKVLEKLVHDARTIKAFRAKDIQRAQNVIGIMNDIIKKCDELRK